jgi:hypothetical protein
LLQETEAFVRAHASSTKTLGAELWQALGQDVKGQTQFLRFRHGMVTRQHMCICYIIACAYINK